MLGWRVLGVAQSVMRNFSAAVGALTNAVRLGDNESYAMLIGMASEAGQFDVVTRFLPEAMKLQKERTLDLVYRIELTGSLVAYSTTANREDVFLSALDGLEGPARS